MVVTRCEIADVVDYIPAGNSNRPGTKLTGGVADKFIVHETANEDAGATALMHRDFAHGGGGENNVSFHFCVDDQLIVQLLPLDECAYQAGDGWGIHSANRTGVAAELCVNAPWGSVRWLQAKANMVRLARWVNKTFYIPASADFQHNKFSSYGKDCPKRLRANGEREWRELIAAIAAGDPAPAPQPNMQWFPETRKSVGNAFLDYWRSRGGLQVFGYPITGEMPEGGRTVQYFERARFEWHPEQADARFKVQLGLLGAERLRGEGRPVGTASVGSEFESFYQANGGLEIFGVPVLPAEDEVIEGSVLKSQWFERARMEYHHEMNGGVVMLGRLGAELKVRQDVAAVAVAA